MTRKLVLLGVPLALILAAPVCLGAEERPPEPDAEARQARLLRQGDPGGQRPDVVSAGVGDGDD
ncbi:MAG: hypothetical protein FJ276_28855 [Planctomycetes bacterium]|nr:hypothetical protein [Planctomycetota bacterium]